MNDHDLERLARLCALVDHLEQHGRHDEAERFARERDDLLTRKAKEKTR